MCIYRILEVWIEPFQSFQWITCWFRLSHAVPMSFRYHEIMDGLPGLLDDRCVFRNFFWSTRDDEDEFLLDHASYKFLQHLTPYHYLVIEFQRTSELPCIFHITKSQIPVISHCKRPSLFNRVLPVSARLDKTTWPQKSQVWPQRLKLWRKMQQSSLIASVS